MFFASTVAVGHPAL